MYLGCYVGIIYDDDDNANNDDENEFTKNSNCNMAEIEYTLFMVYFLNFTFIL